MSAQVRPFRRPSHPALARYRKEERALLATIEREAAQAEWYPER